MPWGEAEALLAAYDASRAAAPSATADTIGLCGYCGVPRETHHHGYVSTAATLAAAPHRISCEHERPSVRDTMGPADGGQKMRLLDRLHASTTPVEEPDDRDVRDRIADVQRIAKRLVAHARGFQDVLDEPDGGPWASLVRADIDELVTALAVLPAPADRPAVLAEVEHVVQQEIHNCGYPLNAGCDFCNGVTTVLEKVRRLADEAQQAGEGR